MFKDASRVALVLAMAATARADLGVPISDAVPLNANAATDGAGDSEVRLASDGNGSWVAVWSARGTQGGPFGSDTDVFSARSIDNGQNWSSPIPLNSTAAIDAGPDSGPAIATDRQGHWVAVWHAFAGGGTDFDIVVSRSTDNGATWTGAAPLNNNAATDINADNSPRIATDEHGRWLAVWQSVRMASGADSEILFARSVDNGANWSNPLPLNSNAAFDTGDDSVPSVAMDEQGRCVAVWQVTGAVDDTLGGDSDVFVARSLDSGAHWSAPIPLNANASVDDATDGYPDVAMDNNGNCVAVWLSSETPLRLTPLFILTARSIDGGANWSLPAAIHPHDAGDRHIELFPAIVTDRLGRWVVAWRSDGVLQTPMEDADLFIVRSGDNGSNWSSPSPLNTDASIDIGHDLNPSLATDRKGMWLGAWHSNKTAAGAVGNDDDLRVARFALPDCNSNLISDRAEIAAGISPDVNGNSIPDGCETSLAGPAIASGPGISLCGGGIAALAPIAWAGMACMARVIRRRQDEQLEDV